MKLNKIPIFYYHSIAPFPSRNWYRSYLTFKLSYFEDFVRYLSKQKYKFLTLDEYFYHRLKSNQSESKMICFTFDDGYLDNYVFVYPILRKYGAKATIFVNPEFVQDNEIIRPTLNDVWEEKISLAELPTLGFVSWSELLAMQASGVIDVQSHTMTHTKYFVSDKIVDFHHPFSDYLYPIINSKPDGRAYYMTDTEFIKRLPWGTPYFEGRSSLVAKRVMINEQFNEECVSALKSMIWEKYSFAKCLAVVEPIHESYKQADKLITHMETTIEYETRVRAELRNSKKILEERLKKPVLHCCWPHGEYNEFTHYSAKDLGYTSSLIVLHRGQINNYDDRFDRTGSGTFGGRWLSKRKAIYKLNAYRGVFPYNLIQKMWYFVSAQE